MNEEFTLAEAMEAVDEYLEESTIRRINNTLRNENNKRLKKALDNPDERMGDYSSWIIDTSHKFKKAPHGLGSNLEEQEYATAHYKNGKPTNDQAKAYRQYVQYDKKRSGIGKSNMPKERKKNTYRDMKWNKMADSVDTSYFDNQYDDDTSDIVNTLTKREVPVNKTKTKPKSSDVKKTSPVNVKKNDDSKTTSTATNTVKTHVTSSQNKKSLSKKQKQAMLSGAAGIGGAVYAGKNIKDIASIRKRIKELNGKKNLTKAEKSELLKLKSALKKSSVKAGLGLATAGLGLYDARKKMTKESVEELETLKLHVYETFDEGIITAEEKANMLELLNLDNYVTEE